VGETGAEARFVLARLTRPSKGRSSTGLQGFGLWERTFLRKSEDHFSQRAREIGHPALWKWEFDCRLEIEAPRARRPRDSRQDAGATLLVPMPARSRTWLVASFLFCL
jgi:hypothetical protein